MAGILIVEDDQAMAVALRDGFEYDGYAVTVAKDGATGLKIANEKDLDLIILDVMLPKMSGLDVCKKIRNAGSNVPIILLTARGQEIDKVLGLKMGADDYVTKPFSFMELSARVEAVLRRCARPSSKIDVFEFGEVTLDFERSIAIKSGSELELSAREFRILKYFVDHLGEVVTRDHLLDAVWGYNTFPLTRTVDTHIAKLRQKIEDDAGNPRHIVTVHRSGYKFIR